MNNAWIDALAELHRRGEPCVLVTVVEERGSTPRNAGAKMLVGAERAWDSIGGGHLEFRALQIARELLARGAQAPQLERFALGASLGQCCGGAAVLLFEPLGRPRAHIALFGAGHVGRALAPLLAALPCQLRWIDAREGEFPADIPPGVERLVNDEPLEEVERMPPGSHFIVMTHDHALDLQLTEAILRRGDFAWCGLIGSKSKRARFEHRLRERGIPAAQLARLRCPIGLPEVKGKLPMEIAIAVAGEIVASYNGMPHDERPLPARAEEHV
ncbi:xanthine dehydrogenase accessory protein XdhC [Pseudomonas oryzae]|uniref:Molybdenum cofactor sulfurylase n=1 Tax=Pseudomonas oryzae TaxID=1392877 RepID=A0A1H1PVX5_9PSED|nr:xanthine dehydrogenase accessory protein XdhC [Pseudomonas oryzae]SDS15368.1 molybdenum cofactor sulfurylase [Pseudomonas oryzae]